MAEPTVKGFKSVNIVLLFLAALVVANSLLLAPEGSLGRAAGAMMLLLLPGLAWSEALRLTSHRIVRWTMGLGLSYVLMIGGGLLLHYLPGGISMGLVLISVNVLSLAAIIIQFFKKGAKGSRSAKFKTLSAALLAIVLYGGLFRFVNLGYSEFQGDEVKALVPAAGVIEGEEESLFFPRKKGPGEVLVPMMVWRLTGLIDEPTARALFAIAGVMVILSTFLLAEKLFGRQVGLIAAGLVAVNGFMVAFSRIVQYQEIVVWMSLLALLCAWEWQQDGRNRWWLLSGIFVGAGILAHYDTVLVGPALIYLLLAKTGLSRSTVKGMVFGGVAVLLLVGLFFGPYFLFGSQLDRTGDYLERRIDLDPAENSLYHFFFFTIFYNSFYFVAIVGGLALGYLLWALVGLEPVRRLPGGAYMIPALAGLSVMGLSFWPGALTFGGVDWAFIPFTLIFLGALWSPAIELAQRVVIVWLATTFLGYNFVIGDPRTHVYTIVLPLILLASVSAGWVWRALTRRFNEYVPVAISLVLVLLFSGHLYVVYLRQNPEYETDWPESQSWLYWFPYTELSRHDTFGFVHKVGWKSLGGLVAAGQIEGDYQTNGLFEISEWYTRHQLQGCYLKSDLLYAVGYRLIDPDEIAHYGQVGEIDLPNGKGITIYQLEPVANNFGTLDVAYFDRRFDATARPAAFVPPVTTSYAKDVNLADAIRLIGYDITAPEPKPGGRLAVRLHWQARKQIPFDLHVFVHLEDNEGSPAKIWGQSNGTPDCGARPTSTWTLEKAVDDRHILVIDPDIPPGTYKLVAGMYLPEANQRVPIFDETGKQVAESIELATVTIE